MTLDPKRGGRFELAALRDQIAQRLATIASRLPADYKLTLVARHTKMDTAEIIVTDDSISEAIKALQRHDEAAPAIEAERVRLTQRVAALEGALKDALEFATSERIGTIDYMEGCDIYEDLDKLAGTIRAALGDAA